MKYGLLIRKRGLKKRRAMNLFFVLAVILSVLTSCSLHKKVHFQGTDLDQAERTSLLALTAERSKEITSFRALLRAKLEAGGEKSSVRYVIAARLPRNLRLETLAPNLGYALGVMIASESDLLLLDPAPKIAYSGKADAKSLKQALNIPLELDWLSSLIMGRFPASFLQDTLSLNQLEFKFNPDHSIIMMKQGKFERYAELRADQALLKNFQLRDKFNDKLLLEIVYTEYQNLQGMSIPKTIELHMPTEQASIRLLVTAPQLNGLIADNLFELKVPAQYTQKPF